MRICFISRRFFPTISGMSVYARNLLRELVRGGHDVVMVSQYRGDELGTRVYGGGPPPEVEGVEVVGLESLGEQDGGDFERDVRAMVETVVAAHRRKPFDIIHAQYGYPTGLAALEASRLVGVPNVVSIQGGDGHWVGTCCRTHKLAMQSVLDHAGALLIGSSSFAAEVNQNHGTPLSRFTIIPGAVDTRRFLPREGGPAMEFLNPERPVVLYHGRIDVRKGVLVLLDAFASLTRESGVGGVEAIALVPQLIISGIGPDYELTLARVSEMGLDAFVTLTGYTAYEDAPGVYRGAEVFVSPTYAEGFSNTILEAMATGLPIISTFAVGVVDCLRHDENALLIQPGDVSALANALRRMIEDAPLRSRLAARALAEARELYSWPTVARQIVEVYERLRFTEPDAGWSADIPIDPHCRFRAAPHLL